MQLKEINQLDWFWIGLKFGFGFAIAGSVIGTITFLIGFRIMLTHTQAATEEATRQLNTKLEERARSIRESIPKPRKKERVLKTRLVDHYVPARNKEDCLLLTDGVANEQYQKCRSGYTTQRREEYWVWE